MQCPFPHHMANHSPAHTPSMGIWLLPLVSNDYRQFLATRAVSSSTSMCFITLFNSVSLCALPRPVCYSAVPAFPHHSVPLCVVTCRSVSFLCCSASFCVLAGNERTVVMRCRDGLICCACGCMNRLAEGAAPALKPTAHDGWLLPGTAISAMSSPPWVWLVTPADQWTPLPGPPAPYPAPQAPGTNERAVY